MKVLIAEDDFVARTILRRTLESLGHECLATQDGQEAWEKYREVSGVDLIVSDWMMTGMDGLELCRRVRSVEREEYTYFIFLTALSDKEHLLRGIEAGADDYLSKPLDRDELQVRLVSATRVTSLHRRLAEKNGQLEKLNSLLHEQSRQDPLTGLGNRLRLREDLEELRGRVERYGHGYCAVLCDVDLFKPYNDRYGHSAGDEALRRIADTVSGHCRSGDLAYRYGGEELLVLLPEQTLEYGRAFAERLRVSVEELRIAHEDGPAGILTISAGIAVLSGANSGVSWDPEAWLKEADSALYRAKAAGKNRVVTLEEPASGPR